MGQFPENGAMKFIADNWQLVFGGVGTAVVAAVAGAWAKSYFDRKSAGTTTQQPMNMQQISGGNNSTNVQAGRDANVSIERK
jgi:hypothetical protein